MSKPLQLLDLFSGIGGFSLGLERTGGFATAAFCEVSPFPRAVLAHHWPKVPCYDDVRTLSADRLAADGIAVDAICGGFPCQDISFAGLGAGLSGARSGLWWEFHRLIGEIRPSVVIAENVAALRSRGLDEVLRSIAALGYDAEWHCIPAASLGAPHRRDRVWIIAYASVYQRRVRPNEHVTRSSRAAPDAGSYGAQGVVADATNSNYQAKPISAVNDETCGLSAIGRESNNWRKTQPGLGRAANGVPAWLDQPTFETEAPRANAWPSTWEDGVPRVCGKIPLRRSRLSALGNAVVPQIPELIGRAVLRAMERAA